MKIQEKIRKIKRVLKKINDAELYNPEQIVDFGVVLNNKFEPTLDRVYKLIKRKILPAQNLGDEIQPRWYVKGKDLKDFVENKYFVVLERKRRIKSELINLKDYEQNKSSDSK